jgi:hypothetical protein
MALGEDGDGVGSRRRMGLSDAETRSDTKTVSSTHTLMQYAIWYTPTYMHTHAKAIYIPIYIYVMCVCTTCISKYIEILQITAATATLCLWDSETFNFLLCFSPFMSMSSWCCKVLGWSSTWGCCGRGPCGPRGPCRGRTQLFLAPDVQFLWQHLSLCRYTMQDHTIQYHTTIQHHNGFN